MTIGDQLQTVVANAYFLTMVMGLDWVRCLQGQPRALVSVQSLFGSTLNYKIVSIEKRYHARNGQLILGDFDLVCSILHQVGSILRREVIIDCNRDPALKGAVQGVLEKPRCRLVLPQA